MKLHQARLIAAFSSSLLLAGHALAAGESPAAPSAASGTGARVEKSVTKGAHAAASGVERGAKAAVHGVERGVNAAARGVEHGAKATAGAAGKVSSKMGGSSAPPAAEAK